jgi:large subunit ribosomal protein L29
MKNSELRGLSIDELANKLAIEKESYNKLTFAHAITPIENPMKIRLQSVGW